MQARLRGCCRGRKSTRPASATQMRTKAPYQESNAAEYANAGKITGPLPWEDADEPGSLTHTREAKHLITNLMHS